MAIADETIPIITENELAALDSIDKGTNGFLKNKLVARLINLGLIGIYHRGEGLYHLSPTKLGYAFLDGKLCERERIKINNHASFVQSQLVAAKSQPATIRKSCESTAVQQAITTNDVVSEVNNNFLMTQIVPSMFSSSTPGETISTESTSTDWSDGSGGSGGGDWSSASTDTSFSSE